MESSDNTRFIHKWVQLIINTTVLLSIRENKTSFNTQHWICWHSTELDKRKLLSIVLICYNYKKWNLSNQVWFWEIYIAENKRDRSLPGHKLLMNRTDAFLHFINKRLQASYSLLLTAKRHHIFFSCQMQPWICHSIRFHVTGTTKTSPKQKWLKLFKMSLPEYFEALNYLLPRGKVFWLAHKTNFDKNHSPIHQRH